MRITKRQLRRIIKEETAIIARGTIEDIVMAVLSDEGGAAGLDPIEDELEELEDDEISLPDEPIEDIVGDVPGVKRHADGDYIDTTQLEGRRIKITKRQLRRIIKEEKAKIMRDTSTIGDYYAQKDKDRRAVGDQIKAAYRVLKTLAKGTEIYRDQLAVIDALEEARLEAGYTGD